MLFDENGDPAYLAVYVNGGKATAHGQSLREGRERFTEFFDGGGSYVGHAQHWFAKHGKNYANLWDGGMKNSGRSGYQTVSFAGCEGPFCEYLERFGAGGCKVDSSHWRAKVLHELHLSAWHAILRDGNERRCERQSLRDHLPDRDQRHDGARPWSPRIRTVWRQNEFVDCNAAVRSG